VTKYKKTQQFCFRKYSVSNFRNVFMALPGPLPAVGPPSGCAGVTVLSRFVPLLILIAGARLVGGAAPKRRKTKKPDRRAKSAAPSARLSAGSGYRRKSHASPAWRL
jgi:hypothetical protein